MDSVLGDDSTQLPLSPQMEAQLLAAEDRIEELVWESTQWTDAVKQQLIQCELTAQQRVEHAEVRIAAALP